MERIGLKYLLLALIFLVALNSCEEIEVLPPPEFDDNPVQTGTGNSDAKSILFIQNSVSSLFIDPISSETYLVTEDPNEFLASDQFAKPVNPADPSYFSLDVFPTLLERDFMALQPPVGNLKQSNFPGAFGVTIDPEWGVNSNWWELEPQFIDYGFDINNVIIVEGSITENTTWTKTNKYLLRGQVFVKDGVTLTIEPGTVVFGEKAVGTESGVLVFNRGAKIDANGTPEEPIIFTGTSLPGERTRGQWGGVVFCGKAISNKGDNVLLEGIQGADAEDGLYGGSDPNDSSGSFSYWRVEYAGIAISPGNEINSITFGGAGSETSAHHIIVTYAGDDAVEWFGGSADLSYVATYNTLDDDLDMDAGYQGNVQYAYLIRNPFAADESGAAGFEISSSKSVGTQPQTKPNISNVTIVGTEYQLFGTELFGDPKYQGGMFSKQDAGAYLINSVLIGCPVGVQNQ